ncbi:hypothetical protein ACIQU4_40240 [Streptomyces sp. NPDC090741]|uniref:hypothetical protein n=1 Tax=Streptomyces sp. NPDC090741 TaxID=3365967 RepID=UPI00381EA70B
MLLAAGVTLVAEAAYQDQLWRTGLEPLTKIADLRIIRCTTPTPTIIERMTERADSDRHRAAHGDRQLLTDIAVGTSSPEEFVDISLDAPTLLVDTSDGYQPGTAEIGAFIRAH